MSTDTESGPPPRVSGPDGEEYELRVRPSSTSPDDSDQEQNTKEKEETKSPVRAGQWAAGGLSTAAVGAAGLYQLAGPWGLAAGCAATAVAGTAWGVHRLRKGRQGRERGGRMRGGGRGFRPLRERLGGGGRRAGGLSGGLGGRLGRMGASAGGAGAGRGRAASMGSAGLGKTGSRAGSGTGPSSTGTRSRGGGRGSLFKAGRSGRGAAGGLSGRAGAGRGSSTGPGARGAGARSAAGGRMGGLKGLLGGAAGRGARSARSARGRVHATADGGHTARTRTGGAGGGLGRAARAARAAGGRIRGAAGRVDAATGGRLSRAAKTARERSRAATGRVASSGPVKRLRKALAKAKKSRTGRMFAAVWGVMAIPIVALWHKIRPPQKTDNTTTKEESTEASAAGAEAPGAEEESVFGAHAPGADEKVHVPGGGMPDPEGADPDLGPAPAGPEPTIRIAEKESRAEVSINPLTSSSAQMNVAVSSYVPEDMWAVRQEIRQLPQMCENVAFALRTYVTRLNDNYPIDDRVLEALYNVFKQIGDAATTAQEVSPLFERVHADEIRRRDAPRPNERAWNV
ncbi:hypothetical protein [Nocardiopsis sp. RV163]|uniref:hypothetical protein n=1 Tax=Nocardiopsis sp. RV163 TaxID=1661388 RepID=UPI00064B95C4|nr:hypothetical protein [Nocardiopsis sp. RV163]